VAALKYFAYGSNMSAAVMAGWCPGEHTRLGPARLPGFRLAYLRESIRWQAGAADVVEDPEGEVWGVLYEISEEAVTELDRKEFAGAGYRRREVSVECDGAVVTGVTTYEVIDKAPTELAPRRAYVDLLLAASRDAALPDAWLEALRRQAEALIPLEDSGPGSGTRRE
jgi:cation transport regulator ChaC